MSTAADPVAIARDLVRCPSVTPAEGGALKLLAGLLERAGFAVHRATFSQAGTADIDNLFARIGSRPPHLVIAGHTDVVPPGDETAWTHPPFAAAIADGVLYGRGAVDMKGAIACGVAAALDHVAANGGARKGSLSFLITGDEEDVAVNGTIKLLKWAAARGETFDHCLLGEPTNPNALGDMLKIGRRGSLTGRLVVTGRQGHVAYPQLADNPIPHLTRLMGALMAEPLDHGSAHFDPSNLEFVTVDVGNRASNIIPGEARARFNIRYNDCHSRESLKGLIEARAGKAAGHAISYAIEWEPSNSDVFLTGAVALRAPRHRRDRRGHRPHAGAVDLGRHVGCALHQGLLPGGRVRPGRADHASGRRAGAGWRPRRADGDLPAHPGPILRLISNPR